MLRLWTTKETKMTHSSRRRLQKPMPKALAGHNQNYIPKKRAGIWNKCKELVKRPRSLLKKSKFTEANIDTNACLSWMNNSSFSGPSHQEPSSSNCFAGQLINPLKINESEGEPNKASATPIKFPSIRSEPVDMYIHDSPSIQSTPRMVEGGTNGSASNIRTIPEAVNVAIAKQAFSQDPWNSAWAFSDTADLEFEFMRAALSHDLRLAQKTSEEKNSEILKLTQLLDCSSRTQDDLKVRLHEKVKENINAVSSFSTQLARHREEMKALSDEKAKEQQALTYEYQQELDHLNRELKHAQTFSSNLENMQKDNILEAAAADKAEAEYAYRKLQTLNNALEGNLPNSVSTDNLIALKDKSYQDLERRHHDEVNELKEQLQDSQSSRDRLSREVLSQIRKVETRTNKCELLMDMAVKATADFKSVTQATIDGIETEDIAHILRSLLEKSLAHGSSILDSVERYSKESEKYIELLQQHECRLSDRLERIITQTKEIEQLEDANKQKDVKLADLEIKLDVLRKRAKKTCSAKNELISTLVREKDSAFDQVTFLASQHPDTQQAVALRALELENKHLRKDSKQLMKQVDELLSRDHDRQFFQKQDNLAGMFLEQAYQDEQEKNKVLEQFCREHGLDPYANRMATLPKTQAETDDSAPTPRPRFSSSCDTMGSIISSSSTNTDLGNVLSLADSDLDEGYQTHK